MRKTLIFTIMLVTISALGFSQANWMVNNTAGWIEAVNGIRNGGNNKTYTITVSGTVSVLPTPASENTFGSVTGLMVTMQGGGVISPSNNGSLLRIGDKQTLVVKELTLKGRDNNDYLVSIGSGSSFRMENNAVVSGNSKGGVYVRGTFTMQDNASVTGNTGGGVCLDLGTFTMKGNATVSGNTTLVGGDGGGVYTNGTFTMQDNASVSGNTSTRGGGVYMYSGTFTMKDNSSVSGNTSNDNIGGGGGVYVRSEGATFIMQGSAKVSGNTANKGNGGGVYAGGTFTMQDNASVSGNTSGDNGGGVQVNGTFTMKGNASVSGNTSGGGGGGVFVFARESNFVMQGNGTVSGNTARGNGGGVLISEYGSLTKTGGTIYGSDETDAKLKNTASKGNAVYNGNQWRNATAGAAMNSGTFGFWLSEVEEVTESAFPSSFTGTWKRDNFGNTLTFTANTLKASNQSFTWNLQSVSGDAYTIKVSGSTATLTFRLTGGNIEISGDSGSGQDNWNGVWKKR